MGFRVGLQGSLRELFLRDSVTIWVRLWYYGTLGSRVKVLGR